MAHIFGIDLRTLALFRISVALPKWGLSRGRARARRNCHRVASPKFHLAENLARVLEDLPERA